jgi:hypothetical protein
MSETVAAMAFLFVLHTPATLAVARVDKARSGAARQRRSITAKPGNRKAVISLGGCASGRPDAQRRGAREDEPSVLFRQFELERLGLGQRRLAALKFVETIAPAPEIGKFHNSHADLARIVLVVKNLRLFVLVLAVPMVRLMTRAVAGQHQGLAAQDRDIGRGQLKLGLRPVAPAVTAMTIIMAVLVVLLAAVRALGLVLVLGLSSTGSPFKASVTPFSALAQGPPKWTTGPIRRWISSTSSMVLDTSSPDGALVAATHLALMASWMVLGTSR